MNDRSPQDILLVESSPLTGSIIAATARQGPTRGAAGEQLTHGPAAAEP